MLFQKSVQKKYIAELDKTKLDAAFQKLIAHFGNPSVQDNIRKAKEEQYQEGFLRELFVDVFGYTLNPQPNFNLTTELKNETNSKKADGAILKDNKAVAVIELKSLKTTDLQAIELQAFNYKNNQSDCVYVVTSNFQKLRFYIENAVEFEEFDLFSLTRERFALLYLCLSADSILSDLPLRIKKASLEKEEDITRKLYADYSLFKQTLFKDIAERNKDVDRLLVFKKTQKLLDRFLFVFFAEDKGLLPPNSITEILNQWDKLNDLDAYTPLYSRFQKYFGYLNTGYKGKTYDIFAYNGGLFAPDAVLDAFVITDNVLYNHARVLSHYDFDTDVDTNILGHIFEHSLNEMDEIAAHTEGALLDKTKTKRKKDGIFYTPRYITKYIVENTVGALCRRKQAEIGLNPSDIETITDKKKRHPIHAKITDYRTWLLGISILDPACGSGAFLNQALEFLKEEHRLIDTMTATLFGDSFLLTDNVTEILENNIFGVDINEESVEIARLSLWLRTAKVGRKLNDLSRNIKCGNSLIEVPSVAGDKAFDWQSEFKHIFDKGGFDVVIGNPPYVRAELLSDFKNYFSQNYKVHSPASDLFAYFYEKAFQILSPKGVFAYISNTFDKTNAGKEVRQFLQTDTHIKKYIDFTEVQIFEGATTYPVIIIADKDVLKEGSQFDYIKIPKEAQGKVISIETQPITQISQQNLDATNWTFKTDDTKEIFSKIVKNKTVSELFGKCYYGVKTGLNEAFIVPKQFEESDLLKPIYEGKEIKKWQTPKPEQQLILFPSKWTKAKYGSTITEEEALNQLKMDYPILINQLLKYQEQGKKRYDKGDFWWEMRNCAYYDLFKKPKIIFPNLQNKNKFAFDNDGVYINAPAVFVSSDDKALLCILNSKLVWAFLTSICVVRSGGYIEVKPQYFEQIPIPEYDETQKNVLTDLADKIIALTAKHQTQQSKFLKLLQSTFPSIENNRKMSQWYELSFSEFRKELTRQKAVIPVKELLDWQELFETQCADIKTIQADIAATDKAIDVLVYGLYGLTAAEIGVVEK